MKYTEKFNELKSIFKNDKKEILIPGSEIRIVNNWFNSDEPLNGFSNTNDSSISENRVFSYPVFVPKDKKSDKIILLLHGLNERSWTKYLVWAYYICENTNSYVVLFPISFHMNRSPSSWMDPRAMVNSLKERISQLGDIKMSSFANVALSRRLTEDPLRFFNSGHQTVTDLVKLMTSIKKGEHDVIPNCGKVDIFAYSIGAFMSEIMLMGNPGNIFADSKLFIFCGGSVFGEMHGSSKLIMDSHAYEKVYHYYIYDFEKAINSGSPLSDFLNSNQTGMAFRSMIDLGRFRLFRENILKRMQNRIHTITLLKDTIIPSKGIVDTLDPSGKEKTVDLLDFPYNYTHENPFPVSDSSLSRLVDDSFERIFSSAVTFLS
jgi:hypothetical protein